MRSAAEWVKAHEVELTEMCSNADFERFIKLLESRDAEVRADEKEQERLRRLEEFRGNY